LPNGFDEGIRDAKDGSRKYHDPTNVPDLFTYSWHNQHLSYRPIDKGNDEKDQPHAKRFNE